VDKPGSFQLSDLPVWQAMESIRDYRHIYTLCPVQMDTRHVRYQQFSLTRGLIKSGHVTPL